MSPTLPVGPFEVHRTADGIEVAYYIVPFDKRGECEAPRTLEHLLSHLDGFTDVFLFSHGWNNDWTAATERYRRFIEGYGAQRTTQSLAAPAGYRPLLVGVFWPSQGMLWFESETGPGFAGAGPAIEAGGDGAADADGSYALIADIAAALPATQRARFLALMRTRALSDGEGRELADLLAAALRDEDHAHDEEGPAPPVADAEALLAAATEIAPPPPDVDEVGSVALNDADPGAGADAVDGSAGDEADEGPIPAGLGDLLGKFDPRHLIKPFTVWQMKDRAGVVGTRGVSALLDGLLARSTARVHLLGHSFGCKVVMSALAALPSPVRKVHSAVLLQPAVSQYAFAPVVPGTDLAGGYHHTLAHIERPVVATFSANDVPLTQLFHIALRRRSDLGEPLPAAAGEPPSRYAALGGFGPRDSGETNVPIKDPGEAYDFGSGARIFGILGTRTIDGHGGINHPSTWWLAHSVASDS